MSDAGELLARGLAEHRGGRLAEAERLYRLALRAAPEPAAIQHLLGMLMHQTGRSAAGAALILRALEAEAIPQYRHSLAGILMAIGRTAEAAAELRRFIAEEPGHAEGLLTLAGALRLASGPTAAVAWARRTLAVRGDYAEAEYNLGNWLQAAGEEARAVAAYRRVLQLRSDYGDALANLAPALLSLGRPSEAWRAAGQAIALLPSHAAALNNWGQAVQAAGLTRVATTAFGRAIAVNPQLAAAHSNLLFSLSYAPETTHAALFTAYRSWARRHAVASRASQRHGNSRDSERRLRVGYLSADLRDHPVGHNLIGLIEAHDPTAVELVAYAAVARPDGMTERFRSAFSLWRDIGRLEDERAAALIQRDAVDVLVSVAGHTADNRLLVAALKPAPVQVSLYDLSTTGLETIDAWLTDPVLHPAGTEERFTEPLVHVPCLYLHEPPDPSPDPGPPPASRAGRVTFGSCNNPAKLTDAVIALWARIMASVPGSRLLLKYQDRFADPVLKERLAGQFAAAGIARGRLTFLEGRLPRAAQLAVLNRIDVALDPFPFNGSTTTFEALWMGVPVVALAGDRFIGRVAASFLVHIGLSSLVAEDEEGYVETARTLAADAGLRTKLRGELRSRLLASPLMDPPAYARSLEAAFRQLWRQWCARG